MLRQPITGSHESLVHALPSSQFLGVLAHVPPSQCSFWLHSLPSKQSESIVQQPGIDVLRQPPGEAHESAVHGLPSLQSRSGGCVQFPLWQVCSALPGSPSEHEEASGWSTCWHPTAGSQESAVQGFASSQERGSLTHTPASQRSLIVQSLPSAQSSSIVHATACADRRREKRMTASAH